MNGHFRDIKNHLESMPFKEARRKINFGELYAVGSDDHNFALSWLEGKEAELRDERESEAMRSMRREVRKDRIIAIAAIIIAVIAAREDIKWLISWLLDKLKTP